MNYVSRVRNIQFKAFFLLFLCFGIQTVFGQKAVKINDSEEQQMLWFDFVAVFEDTSGTLTFDQIKSGGYDSRFEVSQEKCHHKSMNFPSTYWVKVKIQPNSKTKNDWIIEFFDQTTDDITAYIPDGSGGYDKLKGGDMYDFEQRKPFYKNFVFSLPRDIENTYIIYFKLNCNEVNDLILSLRSSDFLFMHAVEEYSLLSIFTGMMVVFALINLIMFITMKDSSFLYYFLYIFFVGIYEMSETGLAFQFLWPSSPGWNQYAFGIMLYPLIVFALLFTSSFLRLKAKFPHLHRLVKYTIIARTVWFVFILIFNVEFLEFQQIEIIPLGVAFYCGIYAYLKKMPHARFFVVAYGFLFISFLVKTLTNLDILPHEIITHYSISIGFLVEMTFLSIALGDKIKIIQDQRNKARHKQFEILKEKDELKEKVNRELEQKVAERTQELVEANSKLEDQAEQITELNLKLDLHNRSLEKEVQKTINKRLLNNIVGYEEFQAVFPDNITCLRYLNDLKKREVYSCKKCSNGTFYETGKKFSRRCTKCGYNESITTGTVFKGVKFPLEKAFYLVYLVLIDDDSLTLHDLSKLLELRVNTIWAFKGKVKDALKKKKYKRKDLNSFEDWEFLLTD